MYCTLYANDKGELLDNPEYSMLGRSGNDWVVPEEKEMILLPKGSSIIMILEHIPVGLDSKDKLAYFEKDPCCSNKSAYPVAALLPQGFTRTLLPACARITKKKDLPLFGYAAVGFKNGKIYVAATQSDEHRKWHPVYYNTERLPAKINKMLSKYPQNRILRQLANCSLEYSCFTAQNIFYQRWEGGIPTMPSCNANCIGCLSESHLEVDSPQSRLTFQPDVEEIVDVGVQHLSSASEGIISFGQGCEGEPSLNAPVLSASIKEIRNRTDQGTINMNTNAGYTSGIKQMCDAGLNSIRVTIFSLDETNYNNYHRPKNYTIANVKESVRYALDKGVKVSLNLLVFPGFSDREGEIEALAHFLEENPINMIQLRNLNIDPDYLASNFKGKGMALGITTMIEFLQHHFPQIKIGSYTHPHFKLT